MSGKPEAEVNILDTEPMQGQRPASSTSTEEPRIRKIDPHFSQSLLAARHVSCSKSHRHQQSSAPLTTVQPHSMIAHHRDRPGDNSRAAASLAQDVFPGCSLKAGESRRSGYGIVSQASDTMQDETSSDILSQIEPICLRSYKVNMYGFRTYRKNRVGDGSK